MTQIDDLSAKARQQAAELNQTLDELEKLGVQTNVYRTSNLFGNPYLIARVQLVFTDPPHKP